MNLEILAAYQPKCLVNAPIGEVHSGQNHLSGKATYQELWIAEVAREHRSRGSVQALPDAFASCESLLMSV